MRSLKYTDGMLRARSKIRIGDQLGSVSSRIAKRLETHLQPFDTNAFIPNVELTIGECRTNIICDRRTHRLLGC